MKYPIHSPRFAELSTTRSSSDITLLGIFRSFMSDEFLSIIYNNRNDEKADSFYISKSSSRNWHFDYCRKTILINLAIDIRFCGLQIESSNDQKRFLRSRLETEVAYFKEKFAIELTLENNHNINLGINVHETLMSRFLITPKEYQLLSTSFQSLLSSYGDSIAGDEKLFYFTGNSGNIRLVPSKPDRIGLWFYELCCRFANGLPYMLDIQMAHSEGELKRKETSQTIEAWINVIKKNIGESFLAFDKYYVSEKGARLLNESAITYGCSAKGESGFVKPYNDAITTITNVPFKWGGSYKMKDDGTANLCIRRVEKDGTLRICFTNGFKRYAKKQGANVIPGYDQYRFVFSLCDIYNKQMHHAPRPHKRGGFLRRGEEGKEHDFAMVCILLNTFNAYESITRRKIWTKWKSKDYEWELDYEKVETSFKSNCLALADELFMYAITL
jgi:hypothetical protein